MEAANQFAVNVRRLRLARGLSQERLAEAAGLRLSDISKIETQGREPRVRTIVKLAHGLEVDPGELFAGVEIEVK